jgi:hypothetical protein
MSRDDGIQFEYVSETDACIKCHECGESKFLEEMVDDEIEFAEKYLCELNAIEIKHLACALELEAYKCRKAYEKWAKNGLN